MEFKDVMLILNERQVALNCLIITSYLALVMVGDMKDPVTGRLILPQDVADLATVVEKANLAVGNEPSIEFRKLIQRLRESG